MQPNGFMAIAVQRLLNIELFFEVKVCMVVTKQVSRVLTQ